MSELLVLTSGASALTYGTLAAAENHIGSSFGDAYTSWLALTPDDRKRTLIAATRYLDRQFWIEDLALFADRDLIPAFAEATYELAAMIAEDSSVLAQFDQGSNIKEVSAGGGVGVEFFGSTTTASGSTAALPPILLALLGDYIDDSSDDVIVVAPSGQASCAVNPLADCEIIGGRGAWWR